MLTKWLTDRPSRKGKKDHSCRPWLELLEERNAPSGHGGQNDQGNQGDNDHGHHGPPPPAPPSNSISSSINAHGSFNNSTITDSFNNTMNVTVNLPPAQSAAVGGLLGISNLLSSALSNPQLGTLLNDEIALAVDTYLTSSAISSSLPASVVSSLKSDEATLSAAISANSQNGSPIGHAIGTLVYDTTLDALMAAQATI
jgi:hypothetical protein